VPAHEVGRLSEVPPPHGEASAAEHRRAAELVHQAFRRLSGEAGPDPGMMGRDPGGRIAKGGDRHVVAGSRGRREGRVSSL
jgi:hypothetical protein